MNSPDQEFKLIGGKTKEVAETNRECFIDRVIYLAGIDIRNKHYRFLEKVDMEMLGRWYKTGTRNPPIDEQQAQRMAEVVKDLEKENKDYSKDTKLGGQIASAYEKYKHMPTTQITLKNKKGKVVGGYLNVSDELVKPLIKSIKGGKNGKGKRK